MSDVGTVDVVSEGEVAVALLETSSAAYVPAPFDSLIQH